MLTIVYDPINGIAVPDGLCEIKAFNLCTGNGEGKFIVSSILLIHYIRLNIKQGVIKYNQVVFLFHDYVIPPDKNGMLGIWPHGFGDYELKVSQELLKL